MSSERNDTAFQRHNEQFVDHFHTVNRAVEKLLATKRISNWITFLDSKLQTGLHYSPSELTHLIAGSLTRIGLVSLR